YGTAASSVTIGATGTSTDNKGQATAIVSVGGLAQELPNNAQHGTNAGLSSLRLRGSYTGIGWDFTNWAILETESYPYKNDQCAPPVIYAATSGDTSISGKCLGSGVTVKIGNDTYTAPATNNSWTINLSTPLSSGQEIQAFATAADLNQSYVSRTLVKYKGDGTEASPYEIYTADELQNINSYSYYKLMNDIDLTEWITENNPTGGWIPVGYNGGSFRSLDGDGHSVTGLWTNSTLANYGLISQAQDAIVKNLRVVVESGKLVKGGDCSAVAVGKAVNVEFSNIQVGGNVTGGNYIGGVAGSASSCSFTDCASNVSLTGGNYAGLISGSGDDCDYTRCNTFGTATGNDYVGGITGNTNKTITLSHANVTATGNNYVGGLAGYADTATAINQCFSKGVISATNTTECYSGGIAGINKGSITDCYSAAEVHSGTVDGSIPTSSLKQNVGGITGYNYGNVARCYASGNLYGVKFASGIVGYNDGANAVTNNCFALNNQIQVSNEVGVVLRVIGGIRNGAPTPEANNYALKTMAVSVNNVPQIIYDDLLHGISVTLSSLLKGATYSDTGWDMTNVWDINENNGYPFLRAVEDESPIIMVLAPPTFSPEAGEYAETVTVTMSAEECAEIRYTIDGTEPTTTSAVYSAPLTFTETTTVKAIAVKDGQTSEVVSSTYTIVHQVDHLYVNDFSMKSGDSKEISIQLDNETSLIACEFYMQLPEGFSIAKDDDDYYVADLVSGRINRHTLEVEYDGNGIYHFLCYSNRNNAFVGNSGDFITLTIVANDNVAVGTYTAELKDIIFSDIDKNQVNLANNSFSIEIINVTPGDVNDDGKVNVMDIVEMVSYIMGSPSASFVFAAADLDGNGTVNVMDLVNLVEMIMTSANQTAVKSSAKELMTVDCVELVNSGKNSVGVAFPGTEKFVAAQFTVELKDGNTLNDVTTDGNHRASFTEIGEGKYMVLVYSPDNRTFEGDEAIRLSVNNGKNVTIDNAVLVDVDKNAVTCNAVSSDNSCGVISIEADFSKPVDIYNLNGQLVRKNATSTKGLDKGFYIINNNKIYLR
ncbi:MAG: chitobiase/beta-hexosaminidase C-terminal domain-containing protein, partial [Muribaculaceae bacterium]|nr:chitobiase/beta-hexosaminidase C-terminal domain-containing protein [Muribaculaceae bacterium]